MSTRYTIFVFALIAVAAYVVSLDEYTSISVRALSFLR